MNNANKKIALISDYFNLYLITLFIIFIKPQLFSDYQKNYPWGREEGYNFKTQIIFYNDGVKLKMRINYELWVKGGNYNISGYSVNGTFLIETIPASNIRLKEK